MGRTYELSRNISNRSDVFLFRRINMGDNQGEIMREKLKKIMGLKLSDKEKYELIEIVVHKEYLERESNGNSVANKG